MPRIRLLGVVDKPLHRKSPEIRDPKGTKHNLSRARNTRIDFATNGGGAWMYRGYSFYISLKPQPCHSRGVDWLSILDWSKILRLDLDQLYSADGALKYIWDRRWLRNREG